MQNLLLFHQEHVQGLRNSLYLNTNNTLAFQQCKTLKGIHGQLLQLLF